MWLSSLSWVYSSSCEAVGIGQTPTVINERQQCLCTGTYAYLDLAERKRAVTAALEAVAGRVPVVVGIGASRTSRAQELAAEAERAGAAGLLMVPMSYMPLTQAEAGRHYRTVADATDLSLCVYTPARPRRHGRRVDV